MPWQGAKSVITPRRIFASRQPKRDSVECIECRD